MLCLTLTGATLEEDLLQIERNRPWVAMAELRLDFLDADQMAQARFFPTQAGIPIILTFRRVSDGGQCRLGERERLQTLYEVSRGPFSFVDIEEDVRKADLKCKDPETGRRVDFEGTLRRRGIDIIRSYHDFEKVPADLYGRIARLASHGDIPKVAVTPHSMIDVISLFRVERELERIPRKIIVGMGDFGICTRILYRRCGSLLSYCSDSREEGAAPGHLDARTMSQLYHSDRIDDDTHIYGIIGNPVHHTASPQIHNPGFVAIHFNAVYVPFLVDSVRAFFKLAEILHIYGFSVTVPHKQAVQPYLGKITREVKQIGSCNTVVRIQNMWKGINTDYYGFLAPLSDELAEGRIHHALVIGAGGASRAVVWALHNHGVRLTIVNRNLQKAKALASETMGAYDTLDHACRYAGKVDLVVQTTSVGMAPLIDADPVPDFVFTGKEIVYDLIYRPRMTVFLGRAREARCRTIGGSDMLLSQGKLQFEAFTGYHYPHWIAPAF